LIPWDLEPTGRPLAGETGSINLWAGREGKVSARARLAAAKEGMDDATSADVVVIVGVGVELFGRSMVGLIALCDGYLVLDRACNQIRV